MGGVREYRQRCELAQGPRRPCMRTAPHGVCRGVRERTEGRDMPGGARAHRRPRRSGGHWVLEVPMTHSSQDIQHRLMHYFASVGSTAGRTFGIRDFNAHVMMNAYSAHDRDGLQPALDALIAAGTLSR